MDEPMTLVERLRNPTWETNPNGGDALLNIKQTRETMDRAADALCVLLDGLHKICSAY